MIAVVETNEFLADVNNPEAGDLIPETEGLRKLRWAAKGKERRGGASGDLLFPQLRLSRIPDGIVCENVQSDLSPSQRKTLIKELRALKADWKARQSK